MDLGEFDFEFDESLIALRPLAARASARLLVQDGDLRHHATVGDLPAFLRPGDMLVFNDTKVIPARLFGKRKRPDAEAKVEITLIRETGPGDWRALAKPRRKLRAGDVITFSPALTAEVKNLSTEGQICLAFNLSGPDFHVALQEAGVMPLPPYIAARRAADAADAQDYQPVFAAREGAIAAPTASLHFDEALLERLGSTGVLSCFVTLHVGIGTFLPVKAQRIEDHVMHAEWGEITPHAAAAINAAKARGGRIIPVGTTALRLIESAGRDGRVAPWEGETDIFITPGFAFKVADGLMTNFHLPKSTLMMLVSALMGIDQIRDMYADAIARRYRFFSYGDASLLLPRPG